MEQFLTLAHVQVVCQLPVAGLNGLLHPLGVDVVVLDIVGGFIPAACLWGLPCGWGWLGAVLGGLPLGGAAEANVGVGLCIQRQQSVQFARHFGRMGLALFNLICYIGAVS